MIENSAPNRWIENGLRKRCGEVCKILIGLNRVRLQEFHYLGLFCISVILEIRLCPDVCLYERSSQPIYPSQRQNLLPTLEIITHNFKKIQNFGKKFQNLEFFSKISNTTKGPPMTSKGPPPPY